MDGKAMDGAGSDTAAGAAAVDSGLRGVATLAAHVFCERLSMRSARRTGEAFERGELQERLAVHHGTKASWVFRSWLDVWTDPQFLAWNLESFLPRIRVPLLVIQGEDDEYGTRAQVDAILSGAPTRARELWLPGCGHAPHRDRPAEVERALAEFVSTSIGQET